MSYIQGIVDCVELYTLTAGKPFKVELSFYLSLLDPITHPRQSND